MKVCQDINKFFKSPDAVTILFEKSYQRPCFPCPYDDCTFRGKPSNLKEHLETAKHQWDGVKSKRHALYYPQYFRYATTISKHGVRRPVLCDECNVVACRMDKHLLKEHGDCFVSGSAALSEKLRFLTTLTEQYFHHPKEQTVSPNIQQGNTPEASQNTIRLRGKKGDIVHSKVNQAVLKHNIALSSAQKEKMKISGTETRFHYYYRKSELLLLDFVSYLQKKKQVSVPQSQQMAANVKEIWKQVDVDMGLFTNSLGNLNDIDDYWLMPQKKLIEDNLERPIEEREPHLQATTLQAKLGSLSSFVKFLQLRNIFAGLHWEDLTLLEGKISEMTYSLRHLKKKREHQLKEFKLKHLIEPSDMTKYGKSEHVQGLRRLTERVLGDESVKLSNSQVADFRNHIMLMMTWGNGLRTSNLINATVLDWDERKGSSLMPGVKSMTSAKYDFPTFS